jgi:hypothetical protein
VPCSEPLLIHADGTATCAVPGCLDHLSLEESVGHHAHVVNCRAVLGTRCLICHHESLGDAHTTPAASSTEGEADTMCPGAVLVHADLSFECSEPNCPMGLSRGEWLAHHLTFLPCSRPGFPNKCPLCSSSDHEEPNGAARGVGGGPYLVTLRGVAGPVVRSAFDDVQVSVSDKTTILRGVPDQAALFGILRRIENLALEIVEIKREA